MTLTGHIVGTKGNTGRGIASVVENADYTITINLTDGSSYTTAPIAGFTAVDFDENYDLVVTKTDGTEVTVETDLGDYEDLLAGYKSDAESAKADAESAQTYAETAKSGADASALKAEQWAKGTKNGTPVTSGDDGYQDNSKYYKELAASSASSASSSATSAGTDALKSEGYAVGKQNGTDVSSGSDYYHNNAKYYSEEAYGYASDALTSENNAASSESDSRAYAIGKRGNNPVTSSDPAYHNNSKYYSEQASTSASGASSSATSASTNALKAEGYAVGKQNGTDVTSGSDYYENNAKYYSEQSAISASIIGEWYYEKSFVNSTYPFIQLNSLPTKVYFKLLSLTEYVLSVKIFGSSDSWSTQTLLHAAYDATEFVAEINPTGYTSFRVALTFSSQMSGTYKAIIHGFDDKSLSQAVVDNIIDIDTINGTFPLLKVPKDLLSGTNYSKFYLSDNPVQGIISINNDIFNVTSYAVTKGETYYLYGEDIRLNAEGLPVAVFGVESVSNNAPYKEEILRGYTTKTNYAIRYTPNSNGYIHIAHVTDKGELSVYSTQFVSDASNYVKKPITIQLFGDSITDDEWGDTQTWATYITEYMPMYAVTVKNEAVGGSGIGHGKSTTTPSHQTESYNYVYDLVTDGATLDTNADAVVILIGTNNWAGGTALGDMSSSGYSTVYGALKGILDYISQNSSALVFVCTIPQRYNSTDENRDTNSYGEPINDNSVSLADYCKPFVQLSAFYGYPCIDLNSALGWNRNNVRDFCSDGLHPATIGDRAIAKLICNEISKHL